MSCLGQRVSAAVLVAGALLLLGCALMPSSHVSTALTSSSWDLAAMQQLLRVTFTTTNSRVQTRQKGAPGRSFTIQEDRFVLDGHPIQLLSGSIHYHRIPPDQWTIRLQAVKAMGLNAIQVSSLCMTGRQASRTHRGNTSSPPHIICRAGQCPSLP